MKCHYPSNNSLRTQGTRWCQVLVSLFFCANYSILCGQTSTDLAKGLEPLKPLVGKTWKGPFQNGKEGKQTFDVARWERALNGQAIRVLHSVADGDYGGETIIMWNPKIEKLEYYYFTTAGFTTHGTMTVERNQFISHEEVIGNKEKVTEVKAVSELRPDGKLHVKSLYLKNGEWVPGHEILYTETPGAEVRFK